MKKSRFFITLAIFVVAVVLCGDAFAAEGNGGSIFSTISSKMWMAVGGLRKIAYVLAAFGLVGFTFGAIFNKISWKQFGNIMISLFILSVMTPLIEYTVYGQGSSKKLSFANKYVAPGDHSAVEAQKQCEGADCPKEEKAEGDCKEECGDDQACVAKCGTEDCKEGEESVDGKCLSKCAEGEVRNGGGKCESSDDLARDCYESGGTFADGKCNMAEEADQVSDPCAGLKDDKYKKCSEAKPAPEKPGACSAEEPKCEGGYQSKAEVCAGKEGKDKKKCEKAVDKHNKEVNDAYKKEQKAYEKEQKEIAKDKYEARKDAITAGGEVNCDGLSATQCSRLQSKQNRADEKQAKKDQKDGINQRYEAAMAACHGDPDCEKEAKKTKRKEDMAMASQGFNSFVNKTNSAIGEATQRVNDAMTMVGGTVGAISTVGAGIAGVTTMAHNIDVTSKNMGAVFSGDGSFLDKTTAFFQGSNAIMTSVGGIAATTGQTVGGVTSGLGATANSGQDLFSSIENREQNKADRNNGQETNVFSSVMSQTTDVMVNSGNATQSIINNAGNTMGQVGEVSKQVDMGITTSINVGKAAEEGGNKFKADDEERNQ